MQTSFLRTSFVRTSTKRLIATATAASIAITAVSIVPAVSAPVAPLPAQALERASDGFVEVAKRRKRHYGGNAAALGAFAAIAGTIATLAARDRYRRHYYYDPYYGPPPYAYGYRSPYYGGYGYYPHRYRYYRGW
jgi:hypothetical protein